MVTLGILKICKKLLHEEVNIEHFIISLSGVISLSQ